MSRLQNKLSRRKKHLPDLPQRDAVNGPEACPDGDAASADSSDMRQPDVLSAGEADVDNGTVKSGTPQDDPPQITGSKSDIIAQLQRRMEKIERKKVKAFGTKNKRSRASAVDAADAARCDDAIDDVSFSVTVSDGPAVETVQLFTDKADSVVMPDTVVIQNDALLPGKIMDTAAGEIWLNRKMYPGYYHGQAAVNRYLSVGTALAAFAKDERLGALSPEGALFIDTETTGLSSGAGTLPFLVGCGFFEDGIFVVEQYFCREPSEEPAQLEALAHRLAQATYLVSFNGKSFDMPLVNTRFIINKMKNPGYNLPHLDLLHVCRRIFKRRLNDRSLQNMERVILGFVREGDIPGALIPEAYRDYLFGHGEDQIAAILEHNLLDIVALAALGGVLDEIYNDPDAVADVADHLGLAKEAFGAGEMDIGNLHLDAAEDGGQDDDRRIALHMKARAALRQRHYGDAVTFYLKVLEVDETDMDAHLQLSKLYEHRTKDYEKALHHAEAATGLEGDEAGERRMKRLLKKKEKHDNRKW
ncbi:MAG: ribonuclease H-like domain-containing protein [Deltaproteobacteria bacterium]|nr:ribonuclease H-like domain-containing protein [Deltaproteobacteria bacterium]